ncbi:MAG: hypothetical protein GC189_06950 [Alphaproteobacteria bacterium]|nr:hypothetical protein [Alphaproteobacteria bacterium]
MRAFTSRAIIATAGVLAALIAYAAAALAATAWTDGVPQQISEASAPLSEAQAPLRVTTWNIGYAGLGADADFFADGGRMLRPPSRAAVERNLAAIRATLGDIESDVIIMQEVAGPGLLTRNVDVLSGVRSALADRAMLFSVDTRTRLMPPWLRLRHGLGAFTRAALTGQRIARMPDEPRAILGLIRRRYHVQVTELDVSGRPWTIINLHLSAFDEGANTRLQQLRALFALAQTHHAQGRAVVLGGDWNLVLTETNFPHTSDDSALFWIHPFPREELPQGWRIVADPSTPSVRTNERPFHAGENYTTIIDGFIVSPNVEAADLRTRDLTFRFTDHQPVTAAFVRTD